MSTFSEHCLAALDDTRPYPLYSQSADNPDLDHAYQSQKQFINLRTSPNRRAAESVAGYKAALTAEPAQQAMGITSPIVGVLLNTCAKDPSTQIEMPPGGILETELGYTLKQDVTSSVSEDTVLSYVAACHPMVELALPNLAAKPTGADLVATNSATWGYIQGPPVPTEMLQSRELDHIATSLRDESADLFSGTCVEVMQGQTIALAWLLNTCLEVGYQPREGDLLMTGSVGGVAPAKPGSYHATFSSGNSEQLATLSFTLV